MLTSQTPMPCMVIWGFGMPLVFAKSNMQWKAAIKMLHNYLRTYSPQKGINLKLVIEKVDK